MVCLLHPVVAIAAVGFETGWRFLLTNNLKRRLF
jgi:hypothetical protein